VARIATATIFALIAFAANSILCRMALRVATIDPLTFTSIRITSGAITLALVLLFRSRSVRMGGSWISALELIGYAATFSVAYTALTAGTGALLLFGAVQVVMIAAGYRAGERINRSVATGWLAAVGGIIALTLPSVSSPPLWASFLMLSAGIAWGLYSLRGRRSSEPIAETAGNFLRALPIALLLNALMFTKTFCTSRGMFLAVLSGALASGLGYAAWYTALPRMRSMTAANLQLCVPVIAALFGAFMFKEAITTRLIVASLLVLGGVFVATRAGATAKAPLANPNN
jgi:drug/metabolite transporter (DMT)-like permease